MTERIYFVDDWGSRLLKYNIAVNKFHATLDFFKEDFPIVSNYCLGLASRAVKEPTFTEILHKLHQNGFNRGDMKAVKGLIQMNFM